MSNLPDSKMTATAGEEAAIKVFCQHPNLVAKEWMQLRIGTWTVTAFYCPTCRKTVRL